jgi:hypothetical protein
MAALTKAQAPVKPLVIEASGMINVDYTGSQILQQTIARLRSRSIEAAIARLSDERAEAEASRTGLIAALGPERIFKSVEEAVRRIGPNARLDDFSGKGDTASFTPESKTQSGRVTLIIGRVTAAIVDAICCIKL